MKHSYWNNFESVQGAAKSCKTKSEFGKRFRGAQSAAVKHGWYDFVCAHMDQSWVKPGTHTKENILASVKDYVFYSDWKKENPKKYCAAQRLGILITIKKLIPHFRRPYSPIKWTNNKILLDSRKYSSKREWLEASAGGYKAAKKRGIFKSATSHMERPLTSRMKQKLKPTEQIVAELEIYYKKCSSKSELWKSYPSIAKFALEMGLHDKLARKHFEFRGNRFLRGVYSFQFEDGSVYIGLTYNFEKRHKAHLDHTKSIIDKTLLGIGYEFVIETDYIPIEDAVTVEIELIKMYSYLGLEVLNKLRGGQPGATERFWSDKKIISSAREYSCPKDWRKGSYGSYLAARERGLVKICYSFMNTTVSATIKKERGFWKRETITNSYKDKRTFKKWRETFTGAYAKAKKLGMLEEIKGYFHQRENHLKNTIIESAQRYVSISEFKLKAPGHYRTAMKNGWWEEATAHIPRLISKKGFWKKHENIWNAAMSCKNYYEFDRKYGSAVKQARIQGINGKIITFFKSKKTLENSSRKLSKKEVSLIKRNSNAEFPHGFWKTRAAVLDSAKKYDSITKWKKKFPGAMGSAKKNGWLEDVRGIIHKNTQGQLIFGSQM